MRNEVETVAPIEMLTRLASYVHLAWGIMEDSSKKDPPTVYYPYVSEYTNFARGMFIRSVITLLEGDLASTRDWILGASKFSPKTGREDIDYRLSAEETILLSERKYYLDKEGNPQWDNNYGSLLRDLPFAYRLRSRLSGCTYEINRGDAEWGMLPDCISVRDRLTHPKKDDDLFVSDKEVKDAARVYAWYSRQILEFIANRQTCEQTEKGESTLPFDELLKKNRKEIGKRISMPRKLL